MSKLRLTLVRVHVPFLRRLFSGELVLGIMGTVHDVKLLSRRDAYALMEAGHETTWLPYQESPATGPVAGPPLDLTTMRPED